LQLKKQLESILSDGKIVPLVIAALRLDEDSAKGLMPKKSADIVSEDLFLAIVKSASQCSSGAFSRFVLEKPKPEDDAQLGPFTMCVLHAIIKKASLRIP
jgi:hypothetical protein